MTEANQEQIRSDWQKQINEAKVRCFCNTMIRKGEVQAIPRPGKEGPFIYFYMKCPKCGAEAYLYGSSRKRRFYSGELSSDRLYSKLRYFKPMKFWRHIERQPITTEG